MGPVKYPRYKLYLATSLLVIIAYMPTFENQKTEHKVLRGSEATEGGEGGIPPPTVGTFCTFGLQIVQYYAYLEGKLGLKIDCIWINKL